MQLLRIVVARWWVIVLVCGAMIGATAAVMQLLPRQYTATTTMVIDSRPTDVLGAANSLAPVVAQSYLATQIDILQSERVAHAVVRALGIDRNPVARQQWMADTNGVGTIEAYFAGRLTRNLDVRPSRDSSVVSLSFTGTDPQFAAQVANAFASSYIAVNLELRNQPSKLYANWFDDQLKGLRADAEQAQARVSAFQQRNGIVASDERLDVENARLTELSQQLSIAQSQAVDARSRSLGSAASVRSLPEVSSTPVLQTLRSDLLRAEARLQEASATMGPAHPTHERLSAEVGSLRERLDAELRNASGSVAAVSDVQRQREAELRSIVASQKEKVLRLKAQRDEMLTLVREAETAQRVFDVALQRLAQTRLDSQNTQANAYVLNAAAVPGEPSSPKVRRNLILSAVLGLLLGLAACLMVELLDRRIRSRSDLEVSLQMPVLGSLPRSLARRPAVGALPWADTVISTNRS